MKFYLFFISIFLLFPLHLIFPVENIASLVYFIYKKEKTLSIPEEKLLLLWEKAKSSFPDESLEPAFDLYLHSEDLRKKGLNGDSQKALSLCSKELKKVWEKAIASEKKEYWHALALRNKKSNDRDFEKNPYLLDPIKKRIKPYLISSRHPMKKKLDALFTKKRITRDLETFEKAGFDIIASRPRSFVIVARHTSLPGYIVKVNLDTTLEKKRKRESWEWFAFRCEGAKKIKEVIKRKKIKRFVVADKWIYCLPPKPSPPKDSSHTRHLVILLAQDMNLVSKKGNLKAWRKNITKEHLNDLYTIISRAKGSSYRASNIAFTQTGHFAFIDTEYPFEGPDFDGIRPYLNSEMKSYWDTLISEGK